MDPLTTEQETLTYMISLLFTRRHDQCSGIDRFNCICSYIDFLVDWTSENQRIISLLLGVDPCAYPQSLQTRSANHYTMIRLAGCPGWSQSLLGAQVILLVLLCCGSSIFNLIIWAEAKPTNTPCWPCEASNQPQQPFSLIRGSACYSMSISGQGPKASSHIQPRALIRLHSCTGWSVFIGSTSLCRFCRVPTPMFTPSQLFIALGCCPMFFSLLLCNLVTVSLRSVLVTIQAVLVQLCSQIQWVPIHIVLQPEHFVQKPWLNHKVTLTIL